MQYQGITLSCLRLANSCHTSNSPRQITTHTNLINGHFLHYSCYAVPVLYIYTQNILEIFTFRPGHHFLFTMDVKSLYTVIPNECGLQALAYILDKCAVKEPLTPTLTRLAELVLTLYSFSFNNEFYRQLGGVAMGE